MDKQTINAVRSRARVAIHTTGGRVTGQHHRLPEQWQQLSFPLFWQGCELQVTLDAQRIAIRTSAPVSLRLNGQLISVAEESVFCLGDFILPFNGTATTHQEDE
ncbi:hypothetical protein GMH75_02315 [Escherichia coli]|nr:hypothetical protein [Escherichia coli]EFH6991946.1 hypothetical protein [Escherichia coli]EFN4064287.1 hypothetical protein [Escherichia coli]EHH5063979.1 hypothetical protein [Escherichia coli]